MADFRIVIDVKNVAGGDIDSLAEDIETEFGEDFDIGNGEFTLVVQQKVGDSFFGREPGDDVIEG